LLKKILTLNAIFETAVEQAHLENLELVFSNLNIFFRWIFVQKVLVLEKW